MAIFAPPRQQVTGALLNFAPVNQAVSKLGQALAQARERENMAKIGETAQGGNLAAARDMAMRGGYLQQGMAFDNRIEQDKARAAAASRRAAADAESRRRFDLQHGLQKQQMEMRRQQLARGPAPTAAVRNYEIAKQQGYQGSFMDYQTSLRRASAPPGPEKSYDKEIGKQLAKEFTAAQKEGAKARSSMNTLSVMEKAIDDPNLYTGIGGEAVQNAKKMAQFFGVKVKGVGTGELVSTISKEIAVNNKDKLPGPMSNSDRQFLVDMAPGLQNSRDGNRLIIQLGMMSKRYTIDRANTVREYAKANGGRLDSGVYAALGQLDEQYAGQFSGLMQQLRAVGETPQRSPAAGFPRIQSLDDWRNLPSGTQYMDPQGNMRTKQ